MCGPIPASLPISALPGSAIPAWGSEVTWIQALAHRSSLHKHLCWFRAWGWAGPGYSSTALLRGEFHSLTGAVLTSSSPGSFVVVPPLSLLGVAVLGIPELHLEQETKLKITLSGTELLLLSHCRLYITLNDQMFVSSLL